MAGHVLAHEPEASRYVLREDGELLAVLDYAVSGDEVAFTRTFTRPTHRGQGLAAEVTAFAVDDVATDPAKRIVPVCWYAEKWFGEHPERAGLLATR